MSSASATLLRLILASSNYDRTRALIDGRVRVAGVDLDYRQIPVEEIFPRVLGSDDFDVAEMSLSFFAGAKSRPDDPLVAIPVFISRMFRHSCIYVNEASGVRTPADLRGKRVGVAQVRTTTIVWLRGLLADEYGVGPDEIDFVTGEIEPDLSGRLERGEIDALFAIHEPSSLHRNPARVRRLFADPPAVECAYFERTGIFPIMHLIAVRRRVYEANPWVAGALIDAYEAAKAIAYEELRNSSIPATMLPWALAAEADARARMGDDFWPYGLAQNEAALDTFLRYHHEQGYTPRRLRARDLFVS
jgi:4,5-dihydroxyphthalate decarboxylase